MDLKAFWDSFTWKVPSNNPTPSKVKTPETKNEETEEICVQSKRKGNEKSPKQPTQKSFRPVFQPIEQEEDPTIQFCSINEPVSPPIESTKDLYLKGISGSESDQFLSCDNGSPENDVIYTSCPVASKEESDIQTEPEKSTNGIHSDDFDDCFSSLEDIVVLPCTETSLTNSMMSNTAVKNEKTNCMKKLSMHLAMDFSSLVSADNLAELLSLASQLREDSSLTKDQVTMLKLIEEIPFISKEFLEAKVNIEQADKFFADLEAKKAEITCLKEQDSELKDQVAKIQARIDSSVIAIQGIDNQIFQFQSKRDKMSSDLETEKKMKADLTCTQTRLTNLILTMDHQIQLNLSERPKWEMKKMRSLQREAEILDKFSILRELTF